MSSEELLPSNEIIEAVLKNSIYPILKQLENDIGKLKYRCSIYIDDQEMSSQVLDFSEINTSSGIAQPIRVRFRPTFNANQLKFQVEAVFSQDLSPQGSGFSGFWTKGKINIDNFIVQRSPWVAQYNVWKWRGWK
ncbi:MULTISPECIES: hypothetical protein [Paenibacillus]|uniref:Uncharacterized protein n=1 Tax=Paenibacillus alvei TaxID=44250 RepID=A0ABT4E3Q2_PAEAL|nr:MULTISPECIES: hypothetical protein [Paenibacillus]EPY12853.1 hypothetical protein PAAL66ix_10726 [Paenibacillus alvei A6-6i-x]MCY9528235.1 hypothetical protein [Paenibacillus alvei]SDF44798.1 hypothetical protein SAMN04488689_10525 [Paenibacillus sp. cl6col]